MFGFQAVVVVRGYPGLFVVMGLTCGDVVVGRSRGGGCGMKKEGVSQFVTRVTLDQCSDTRARDHAPSQICSVPYMYSFVVFIIWSCTVPLNLVVSAFSLQKFVVFAFWHYKIHSLLFFHYKVCDIRFFITNFCSISILRLQKFVVSTYWHYKIL